jgi:hypothetical protein
MTQQPHDLILVGSIMGNVSSCDMIILVDFLIVSQEPYTF